MKTKPGLALVRKSAVLLISMAIGLGTVAPSAQAGLKDAMNQLFVGTSTDAQSIDTQRLRGFYGGSMNFRPLSRGIDVLQFAPPKMDAGCGGIDIFFGSFSFINGAQFEQLIRAIAANAVGFAIKAAIKGMCSPCEAILSDLESAIRQLNALAKNTCAIANAMFDDRSSKKLMEQAAGIGSSLKSAVGRVSDWSASENQRSTESPNLTAKGGGLDAALQNPLDGNLMFRAALSSLSNGANTLRAFLSQNEVIEILMGLYGVVIMSPDQQASEQCPTGVDSSRCTKDPEKFGPTISNWDQLFRPRQYQEAGVKVYSCAASDCKRIAPSAIPLSTWGGVADAVNIGLFGMANPDDYGALNATNLSPNSIVGSFVLKTAPSSSSLNQQARAILAAAPMPILNMLQEVQDIPGAPVTLGRQLASVLPDYIAYSMAMEFMSIGNNVFSGQTTVQMPVEYRDNLQDKARQLVAMRPKGMDMVNFMNKTTESLVHMRRLTSSQFKAGGSSASTK